MFINKGYIIKQNYGFLGQQHVTVKKESFYTSHDAEIVKLQVVYQLFIISNLD